MQTLRAKLFEASRFLVGTELVSVRGSMAEGSAIKARIFANELVASSDIDWISITDNTVINSATGSSSNRVFSADSCSRAIRRCSGSPICGSKNLSCSTAQYLKATKPLAPVAFKKPAIFASSAR